MKSGQTIAPKKNLNPSQNISLRLLLVVPFVLQIVGAVGLVGYLSFKNGQQAVNDLTEQVMDKTNRLVNRYLDEYLATPPLINRINADAIDLGLLDITDMQSSGLYYWKQMQLFDNVSYISSTLVTGEFIGSGRWSDNGVTIEERSPRTKNSAYIYATDRHGNRTKVIETVPEYDARSEDWYAETIKAGKHIWNKAYSWDEKPGMISIATSYPIYNKAKKLVGIISVDFLLSKINNYLQTLKVSQSGKIFIIERNGLVIGNSTREEVSQVIDKTTQRLNISKSSDPLIRATAERLKQNFGSFGAIRNEQHLDFQFQGEKQFVYVNPWQDKLGLDWLVVVVVPESNFMAQINANTRTTIVLCIITFAIATLLGLLTSRWIARPILRLNRAAVAIAQGKLEQTIEIKGVREIETLAHSFNQMAQQLQASFADLDKTNAELEDRVRERTSQLKKAVKAAMRAAAQSSDDKKAAEAANRAKSEFLTNMTHELRTPLNAILGFAQILERDSSLTLAHKENLGIISKSGEHLLSLINDILDMSKIEAGRLTLNETNFDLYRLIQLVEEMFALKAKSKGISLLVEYNCEIPQYIQTDEKKLRQVLINLLGNAIKFTKKGAVTLSVSHFPLKEFTLQFEVKDTGLGIAPEEMKQLFQPFGQTESGRKSQQGTGLGLAISREFIQLMGGQINARSVLGQGSTFSFDIRVKSALYSIPRDPNPTIRRRVIGLKPGQPEYRILIADDRFTNRQLLLKLLEPIGFAIREAANGQEAVAIWDDWQPHLIWMDMRMPVMDGFEATQQIKSYLKGQATAIIALTASVFEEKRSLVLSSGCDAFVCKPFKEDEIFEIMAQYLGVRYRYEETNLCVSLSRLERDRPYELTARSLTVMPSEWLDRLRQAAAQLDEKLLLETIAKIPQEHQLLAQALRDKVHNFDFDQILNLAREAAAQ
ncbi:MAG: response regulator [Hydrococcus sp. RU_2_2]|nr:response regulator [Hydrococcus sp. RU_2_2]